MERERRGWISRPLYADGCFNLEKSTCTSNADVDSPTSSMVRYENWADIKQRCVERVQRILLAALWLEAVNICLHRVTKRSAMKTVTSSIISYIPPPNEPRVKLVLFYRYPRFWLRSLTVHFMAIDWSTRNLSFPMKIVSRRSKAIMTSVEIPLGWKLLGISCSILQIDLSRAYVVYSTRESTRRSAWVPSKGS